MNEKMLAYSKIENHYKIALEYLLLGFEQQSSVLI